jgi:hypothetical protein
MRSASGISLLLALFAAVAWLAFSIHGLVSSATQYHVRVLDPVRLGTMRATMAQANALEASQLHWGESAMSAVAFVALLVVLSIVNAVFHARNQARRIEHR